MRRKAIRLAVCAALVSLLLASVCSPALAGTPTMANFERSKLYNDPYADIGASTPAWAASAVRLCYEAGLMQGAGGRFSGGDSLNAAQAVVMADRVHQIYHTGENTLTNGDPWYAPYVDYAIENGIIEEGDFTDYTAPVTRAAMARVFSRALPAEALRAVRTVFSIPDLDDAPEGDRGAVRTLYDAGVLSGSDEYGTFYPDREVTRYEAAAIIARIAFESERKTDVLFYRVTAGPAAAALPQTGELSRAIETGESGVLSNVYSSERSGIRLRLSVSSDAAFEGADLTALYDAEAFKKLLTEDHQTDFVQMEVARAAFGPLNAYRVSGRTDGGARLEYWFVDGQSMYCLSVGWTDGADGEALQKTIDSLAVNGSGADVRYVV